MKIYFYIPSLASGGAERQCAIIASGLKVLYGHDVKVFVNFINAYNIENRKILESASVPVIDITPSLCRSFMKLRHILHQNKDAILFTFLSGPNFIGSLAARISGIKKVYSGIRCGWLPLRKRLSEMLVNHLFSTGTVFNSYKAYDKFTKEGFLVSKSLVISNAIELWSERLNRINRESVRIITVGRYTPEKDYHSWLTVVKNVCQAGYKIKAHIVGWGRLEPVVRRWVHDMGLDDIVVMHPGDANVRELLSQSDIYLSSSTSEGVSNAILEAMNSALPVVTTDAGDAKKMILDGISGYVVEVGDVQLMSQYIIKLINNHAMRIAFGKYARKLLADKYSVDKVVGMYQKLITCGLPKAKQMFEGELCQ